MELLRRLLWCMLGLLLWLPMSSHAVANSSEPAEIAALRASQARSAEELRQQALKLRESSKQQPVLHAWAGLALAEFEGDLEHADTALKLLAEVETEAEALLLQDLKFAVLTRKGTILVNRGRSAETDAVLQEIEALVDATGDKGWRASLLHDRGVLERKLGRFESALKFFEQSLQLLRELDDPVGIARELNSIGMLHGRTGRFSDAVLAHNEALELARRVMNRAEIARSLRLLGILYRNLDDEELGSEYLKEALEYVEERNRREAIALHGELCKSYTLLGRMDEAEVQGQMAVTLADHSGSPPNRVNAYTRMAELRLEQGQIREAERWTERAFETFDAVAVRDQILLRLSRARVWAAKGETTAALKEAELTLKSTREIGDRILERATLDLLSEQQLASGNAASAFVTRKAHQALDKELAMDIAARRIAVLESRLDRQRTEAERKLLERDNEIQALTLTRQRYLGFALITGLAALLMVASMLFLRYREAERSRARISRSRDQLAQLHQALVDSSTELERAAHTDALTGLANRHALARELDSRLARARASLRPLSVLIIDLDHFKQVNDRHGHLAGDQVLKEVSQRLRQGLRADAAIGRWGGEEFMVVLDDCSQAQALAAAERVRGALAAEPVQLPSGPIAVTASIGVATTRDLSAEVMDPLIGAADDALYRAKRSGRNRVEVAE